MWLGQGKASKDSALWQHDDLKVRKKEKGEDVQWIRGKRKYVNVCRCLCVCSTTRISFISEKALQVSASQFAYTSCLKRAPWHKTCTWILAALGKVMSGEGCQTLSLSIQWTTKKQLQKSVPNSSCIATPNRQIAVMSVPYIIPIITAGFRNHAVRCY